MKVALGTFTRMGIEANLGPDVAAGVREALANYARRLRSGPPPVGLPPFADDSQSDAAIAFDLPVDEDTWAVLEREAAMQGATVGQIATHSVLIYLAEIDCLTPPGAATA